MPFKPEKLLKLKEEQKSFQYPDWIKKAEQSKPEPNFYIDDKGHLTIGIGHKVASQGADFNKAKTEFNKRYKTPLTEKDEEKLFQEDLEEHKKRLERATPGYSRTAREYLFDPAWNPGTNSGEFKKAKEAVKGDNYEQLHDYVTKNSIPYYGKDPKLGGVAARRKKLADKIKTEQLADTKELQGALNEKGYNLAVDGKKGPKTNAALKDFQEKNKLPATGTLNKDTKKKLNLTMIGDFLMPSAMADEVQGAGAGYDPQKLEALKRAVLPQFDPLQLKRFQELKDNPGLEFDEMRAQEKLAKKAQEEQALAQKQQMEADAQNPDKMNYDQAKDFFKENKPETVEEEQQVHALLKQKKQQSTGELNYQNQNITQWTYAQTKSFFKDNPPKTLEEEAQQNVMLKKKKEMLTEIEDKLSRVKAEQALKPIIDVGKVIGKGLMRGTELSLASIGQGLTWLGEAASDFTPPEQRNKLATEMNKRLVKWGAESNRFWTAQAQVGIEAPDPEIFRGTFMENPSFLRGVGMVAEAIPAMATAAGITLATGNPLAGAGVLGLVEGAGQYTEAREAGKGIKVSTGFGAATAVVSTITEVTLGPLNRFLKGGTGKVGKDIVLGAAGEGVEEVIQGLWQNMVAKIGYEPTRKLSQGLVEGFIVGGATGGMLGGFSASRARYINKTEALIKDAKARGATDTDIQDMMGGVVELIKAKADTIDNILDKQAQKVKESVKKEVAPEVSKKEPEIPVEEVKPELPKVVPEKKEIMTLEELMEGKAGEKPEKTAEAGLIEEAKKYKSADEFVESQPIVYHGTKHGFEEFSESKLGQVTNAPSAKEGFFFTSKKVIAEGYAGELGSAKLDVLQAKMERLEKVAQRSGLKSDWDKQQKALEEYEKVSFSKEEEGFTGNIKEVVLDIKNPLEKDFEGKAFQEGQAIELMIQAKEGGYDGVIFRNVADAVNTPIQDKYVRPESEVSDIYAVFNKSQIKTKAQLTDIYNKAHEKAPEAGLSEEARLAKLSETPFVPEEKPREPIRLSRKPRTIMQLTRELRGIDPKKAAAAGYPYAMWKEHGILRALKKNGQDMSALGQMLIEAGHILPEEGKNPDVLLWEYLKDKMSSMIETEDFTEIDLDQVLQSEGPAMRAKDKQVKMSEEAETKDKINKTQIVSWIEKTFKVPIRGKATHRFKALGMYYGDKELIRLAKWGDLEIAAHELAHHIDNKMKQAFGNKWRTEKVAPDQKNRRLANKELEALDYKPDGKRKSEGFAEFIRHYLTTGMAQEKAPVFYKFFTESFLTENPELAKNLSELRKKMDIWQKQGAEQRIIQHIDFKGEHTTVGGFTNKIEKAKDWWLKNWTDEFWLVEKIEKQMGLTSGKNIPPSKDPYALMTYLKSKSTMIARTMVTEKAVNMKGEIVGPSLKDILSPIPRKDMKSFIAYAVAKRVLWFETGRKELTGKTIETGIDVDDAKYIHDKYKNDVWDKAVEDITTWSEHLLDWVIDAGGLTKEEAEVIRKLNPIYLPFKRAFIDEVRVTKGIGGFVDRGAVVKGIKGSGRPILNPIESLISQATEMIAKAHKIRIAAAFADLALEKGVGGFITKVPAPIAAKKINLASIKDIKGVLGELGLGVVDEKTGEFFMPEDLDLDKMVTAFTQSWQYKGKDNIVSIIQNGVRVFYEIHPDIYKALSGIDHVRLPDVIRIVSAFAKLQRLGSTGLKISFGLVRNPWRDAFTYAIFSKNPKATIFDPIRGLYREATSKEGDLVWRFKRMGGNLSGMMGYDRAATMATYDEMLLDNLKPYGKVLKLAKHPIDTLRSILSFTEMAPRVEELTSSYERNKKEHPDWTEEDWFMAAFNDAQDVTINFTRSGHYGKRVNEVAAFFNSNMQGPAKGYRSARENPGRLFTRGILYLTIPSLLLYWKNKDKQWYKNLPPSYKYNNFFFEVGEDTILRLPVPFELGTIFSSLPLAGIDYLQSKDPDYVKGMMDLIKMQIPDMTPTMIGPTIDVATNKNFLGNPIESPGMQYLPKPERKRTYSTALSVGLSKFFNEVGIGLSPIQIDYLINSHTGGFTRQLPIHPTFEIADIPVMGDIFLRMPPAPKRQLNKFYGDWEYLSQQKQIDALTPAEKSRYYKAKPLYYALKNIYFKNLKKYDKDKDMPKIRQIHEKIREKLEKNGYK